MTYDLTKNVILLLKNSNIDSINNIIDIIEYGTNKIDLKLSKNLIEIISKFNLINNKNSLQIVENIIDTDNTVIFEEILKSINIFDDNSIEFNSDSLSKGQLESKAWLINELNKLNIDLGTVFICAGWYGILGLLLFKSGLDITKIRCFDIDSTCEFIAETFNREYVMDDWKFKSVTEDINDIDYNTHTYIVKRRNGTLCELVDSPDTIINTSCEHIQNFDNWYKKLPPWKLVILQSNNFFDLPEHVNCSKSLQEFSKSCPMKKTLFEGELDTGQYTRFMKIGYV